MTNQAQAKRQPLLILALVLALLPIFTLTSMSTSAATGSIVINSISELTHISDDLTADYVLGQNLDATEFNLTSYFDTSDYYITGEFKGNFDGAGFTISNIKRPLFEFIGNLTDSASISNLKLSTVVAGFEASGILTEELRKESTVEDIAISGKLLQTESSPAGGIAGIAKTDTVIWNSSSEITIQLGSEYLDDVGGLVGLTEGSILNSFAKVNITGTDFKIGNIGGLVGSAFGGASIRNSACSGSIVEASGGESSKIGGLVGYLAGSEIINTFSSVVVTSDSDSKLGGLVGAARKFGSRIPSIKNSYSSGSITSSSLDTGGLVGDIYQGEILNSYATGVVIGRNQVGGLIGYAQGTVVQNTSAFGSVSGNRNVGGLIGSFLTGVAGDETSTVKNSNASGPVDSIGLGQDNFGGLIGLAGIDVQILNVAATGSVRTIGANKIGGLIGWSSAAFVKQASASGVVSSGSGSVGGLVGLLSGGYLDHTIASGAVTGTLDVGMLVGRAASIGLIRNSIATGTSDGSVDGVVNQLEGAFNYVSISDDLPDGPDETLGAPAIRLSLLNGIQDPLPWAQSASINDNKPHLQALLGTGFYVESAPTPSITPSTQTVSGVANSVITPTTAFTPVNLTSPIYSVSPALPAGLGINLGTGVISGTPTSASPSTSYVVTATSGAQSATATVTLVVTAAPSVAVVIPDPPQTSKIISATSEVNENSNGEEIIVLGDFNSPISNIAINGKALNPSDWKQEASKLVIKYVTNSSSKLSIQIWNGQAPLLSAIDVVINVKKVEPVAKPTEAPVATPVITPTPKPIAETGVKKAVVKKKTLVCYKGKKSKKVNAIRPICPKGYKVKKLK